MSPCTCFAGQYSLLQELFVCYKHKEIKLSFNPRTRLTKDNMSEQCGNYFEKIRSKRNMFRRLTVWSIFIGFQGLRSICLKIHKAIMF